MTKIEEHFKLIKEIFKNKKMHYLLEGEIQAHFKLIYFNGCKNDAINFYNWLVKKHIFNSLIIPFCPTNEECQNNAIISTCSSFMKKIYEDL